jgi:hypothetical protein
MLLRRLALTAAADHYLKIQHPIDQLQALILLLDLDDHLYPNAEQNEINAEAWAPEYSRRHPKLQSSYPVSAY